MNQRIQKQLNKCKVANIPFFDEDTTHIYIPKSNGSFSPTEKDMYVGNYYIIYIEDYVIHEPDGFTLSSNWNNGTCPPESRLRVEITQVMGKMIKVNATGCTTDKIWSGWLPKKSVNVIEEL